MLFYSNLIANSTVTQSKVKTLTVLLFLPKRSSLSPDFFGGRWERHTPDAITTSSKFFFSNRTISQLQEKKENIY
jgi:hypothetical protein